MPKELFGIEDKRFETLVNKIWIPNYQSEDLIKELYDKILKLEFESEKERDLMLVWLGRIIEKNDMSIEAKAQMEKLMPQIKQMMKQQEEEKDRNIQSAYR